MLVSDREQNDSVVYFFFQIFYNFCTIGNRNESIYITETELQT